MKALKKKTELWMGLLMLLMVAGIVSHVEPSTASNSASKTNTRYTVVIDAGHGGNDPGKVGTNNALEKEINLKIAYQLKEFLEANDVKVILTRETDDGLYSSTDGNKKKADLKQRAKIVEDAEPNIVISIHQNSFPQASVKGAQVFYYEKSEKSKLLAELIQEELNEMTGAEKKRTAKANGNYYLLLNVKPPIVIVECGFLSNPSEAALLITEEYQEQVAWNIHMGIMQYLNSKK